MLDFPNSPTVNQVFTSGGLSWQWDGTKWVVTDAGTNPVPLPISLGGTGSTTLPKDTAAGSFASLLMTNGSTVVPAWNNSTYSLVVDALGALGQIIYGEELYFYLSRANGTQAAPTAVLVNQKLGSINFQGYSTIWGPVSAAVEAIADQTFTSSALGGSIALKTIRSNTIIPRRNYIFGNNGDFLVYGDVGLGAASINVVRSITPPTYPTSNMTLGQFYIGSWYTTTEAYPLSGGSFKAVTTEAWTASAHGTELRFNTTPNGTVTAAEKAYLRQNGDFEILGAVATKVGGGAWVAPSDLRLKQDVGDYKTGLDAVLALNPIAFRYNGKGGIAVTDKTFVGLDADATAMVLPEIVGTMRVMMNPPPPRERRVPEGPRDLGREDTTEDEMPDTDVLTVDPSALTYVLINAVKELEARLKIAEAKLEATSTKE